MGLLLRLSFFISPQTLPTMNESAPARRKIILEQDLTGFFEKLGQEHRPIFQLLRHVPPATFRILVDDEMKQALMAAPLWKYFALKAQGRLPE